MKSVFSYMLVVILFLLVDSNAQSATEMTFEGEKHLKNIKMLTNGGENAEAYLSFDQKKLILQAKIDGLECDQIFTMNIDGTDKKMVSTGKGRTTCSYFMPGDNKIIYASTHLSGDKCPPNPDFSKGYVWKLYDEFEIFIADANGENIVQVTDNDSYDAEATVSPKGDKIVFTSLRDGDPELYLMDIDGSNQERITFEKGYDGGAFFSQDGSKLVYRASRPVSEKRTSGL
jgi:TolB protein